MLSVSMVEEKEATVTSVPKDTAALAGAAVGSVLAVILVIVAVLIVCFRM